MSLTRKTLRAMGIEDEKADEIISAHLETVDSLKQERDKLKEAAEALPEVQKQLDELKEQAKSATPDEYEEKYAAEHKAFEDYKAQVAAEATNREKAQLYRTLLAEAGVDAKRIDTVMKVTDLSGVEVEDGKIKDADKLTEDVKTTWADFIPAVSTHTAGAATPPNAGSSAIDVSKMSAREYIEYKHSQK